MKYLYIAILSLCSLSLFAQEMEQKEYKNELHKFFNKNTEYQLRAQFSIGGTSPLGMPREIRSIKSYNPTLQLGLEANAAKWFSDDQKWGVRVGVKVESRGMKTKAKVKDYLTRIFYENAELRGYYRGSVHTNVKNTYLTFPISVLYGVNENLNVYGGFYISALIDKTFDGYVYDGVFRKETPIGDAIIFEGNSRGDYDFSDQVRRFQWGTQIGTEYQINSHFKLFGELNYGINSLFNSDFDAISFSMHNIYLNLGFAYKF